MDLERTFAFIWEDEDWITKVLIGAALTLTGIGSLAVIGWVAELARRIAAEEDDTLPEWERIGDFFLYGLKYVGISFIWGLPIALPIILISVLTTGGAMILDDPSPVIALSSIFVVCFTGFTFIYTLALNLLIPAVMVPLAEGESFGQLLNPSRAWKLFKANAGGFLVALLISWLAASLLSIVGTILCLIGVLPAAVISQLFMGHLIGQASAQARENLANLPAVPVD